MKELRDFSKDLFLTATLKLRNAKDAAEAGRIGARLYRAVIDSYRKQFDQMKEDEE